LRDVTTWLAQAVLDKRPAIAKRVAAPQVDVQPVEQVDRC
jgi:hypothetical protein